jgi:hypothetical protein
MYVANNGTVFGIPSSANLIREVPDPAISRAEPAGAVSELTLLKALAIAQNPSLAAELTK